MQLAMSIGLIVAGLFLALIVDYQNDGSEMRLFGWVLVAMGLLGIVLRAPDTASASQRRPPLTALACSRCTRDKPPAQRTCQNARPRGLRVCARSF